MKTRRRFSPFLLGLCAIGALFAGGCLAPFRSKAPAPIPTLPVSNAAAASSCTGLLLPGTWDRPRDFLRHGFGELAREAGAPLDLVAVDAHVGYYRNRSVVVRLDEDLVAPLRERGEKVWLAGISLGGIGSLLYAAEHPERVSGLVLLSPFLGEKELLEEIQRAGGPLAWQPPAEIAADDWQRRVWSFLKDWHASKGPKPAIYLGFGSGDDFAEGNRLLAGILPPEHVRELPGGHDWKTWKQLWQAFLAADIFHACR